MGAAGQEEGLAHFWVAVLRPRWLPCKNCQIITFWRKLIDFNKVQPLKVVLHRMNMRKHWTWYCFTTTKYINLCDSNLIVQLFTFVCLFFSREKSRQTKVLKKTLLHHWHYFDSPRQVQRRFSDFNSFHFSDTEAFNFRFALLLKKQLEKFQKSRPKSEFTFFQASVSWWTWPPLPRYQGTGIANKLWWGTYPAAHGSNLKSPSGSEGLRPINTYQGLFALAFLCIPAYTYQFDDYMTVPFSSIPRNKRLVELNLKLQLKEIPPQFLGIKTCVLKILHTTAWNLIFHKISGLEK